MSKETFNELFIQKSEEFFNELVNAYPDIPEFKTFKSGFRLITRLNVKTPVMLFRKHVYDRYKDAILNKDETFFLEEHSIEIRDKETWNDFIDKIKDIWKTLDNENKEVIWKYFHILIVLSEKCKKST